MTQSYIDKLWGMSERIKITEINHEKLINRLKSELRELEKTCDHRWPDGTSAWITNSMFCSYCKICGENDL